MPGIEKSTRWSVLTQDVYLESLFKKELHVTPLVARVLVARGFTDVAAAQEFLSPSLQRDWLDPQCIPGMAEVAAHVHKAIVEHKKIAVFGDFDVDGMSSTCLLTLALRRLGADVLPYIPHRFGEGYGLSKEALARVLQDRKPDLIITVDNGIAAAQEVAWLLQQGIDVVVTDHHEPADLVPQGVPVTDPKLIEDCPSRELAGAGVALKLVQVLGQLQDQPQLWLNYIDVAMLGTLSDMMMLNKENRALVSEGVKRLQKGLRPGLVALAAVAGQDIAQISADNLPFSIIPRLNAAGRMGTTDIALDLLLTEDAEEATILAGKLEEINAERRAIEAKLTDEALEQAKEIYDGGHAIVLAKEGWHEGVKGIVASRIVNRYHVPCILFTIQDGVARGSGRSVGSVDLFHAVEQCADLTVRFGGHQGAVGVTVETSKIDAFRKRLSKVMAELPEEEFEASGEVTALVNLDEITINSIDALEALQPFGQGNKKPLFGVKGVVMKNRSRVGAGGAHLCFMASNGISSISSIMFRTPHVEAAAEYDGAVDLIFEAVNETWQGRTKPKLMVRDILYRDFTDEDDGPIEADLLGSAADLPLVVTKETTEADEASQEQAQQKRRELESLSSEELTQTLVTSMIGSRELLPLQKKTLEVLSQGTSCLSVMATGRGKSLIFQVHAARVALLQHKMSVFVYPLRALINDQVQSIKNIFEPLGISVDVLNGETDLSSREDLFARMTNNELDIVLTTPEFFSLHADQFAKAQNISFVVFDEAHHVGMNASEGRLAYAHMPQVLKMLGSPQILATTATATTQAAQNICELLSIEAEHVYKDKTARTNLELKDLRGAKDRECALLSLVSDGTKTVVYVNSREQAQALTRMLRHRIPELGHKIAFYHAGLTPQIRKNVERAFRRGDVCCIIATSAFGEGVNISDIRQVVLYHLPFGRVAFNQMSGRAGRDGKPSVIQMLFDAHDMRVNERILSSHAPQREALVAVYRALTALQPKLGAQTADSALSDEDIAQMALEIDPRSKADEQTVRVALDVFAELGFISIEGFDQSRTISVNSQASHMDLLESARYAEGLKAHAEFESFAQWVLSASPDELADAITKPIVPEIGSTFDGGRESSDE